MYSVVLLLLPVMCPVLCHYYPCDVPRVIVTPVMCPVSLSPHRETLDHNVLGLKHTIEVARKMKKLQVRNMMIDVVMVMMLL